MTEDNPGVPARFGQINIIVTDMNRTMAFYRLLGVEVAEMPEPWGEHHRTITNESPETTVEFDSVESVANWAPGWDPGQNRVVIGFVVESDAEVDKAVDILAREGHRVLQEPNDAFFGARYAVVEDPDGVGVGIMGPIDDSRRSIPDVPRLRDGRRIQLGANSPKVP